MPESTFDLVVVGGGPGGYTAAVRASQLGLATALIEKEALGGVCVNWGCIPAKTLLRNAEAVHTLNQGRFFGFQAEGVNLDYAAGHKRSRQAAARQNRRVAALLKNHHVTVFEGYGRLKDANTIEISPSGETVYGRGIILASGARARPLPGADFDGRRVIGYRDALAMTTPPASAVIVGAGPIGAEFADIWNRFGATVTLLEMTPRVLPFADPDVSAEAGKQYKRAGIDVKTGVKVTAVNAGDQGVDVRVEGPDGREGFSADVVLVAIGFAPNTEDLGLDAAGVDPGGEAVAVDDQMRTNVPHIHAIGDVNAKMGLAHVASAHGVIAAETLAGLPAGPLNHDQVPSCVYAHPEVAYVGLTEDQAREAGHEVRVQQSPFAPNGKAVALNENIGFIKLIADRDTGRLLGAHMIGPQVTELIFGPATLLSMGATVEQACRAVYPHPTLSEALMEGLHALAGRAVHL